MSLILYYIFLFNLDIINMNNKSFNMNNEVYIDFDICVSVSNIKIYEKHLGDTITKTDFIIQVK
jgi:hypothetical protein